MGAVILSAEISEAVKCGAPDSNINWVSAFTTHTQLTFQITTDYSRLHLDKL